MSNELPSWRSKSYDDQAFILEPLHSPTGPITGHVTENLCYTKLLRNMYLVIQKISIFFERFRKTQLFELATFTIVPDYGEPTPTARQTPAHMTHVTSQLNLRHDTCRMKAYIFVMARRLFDQKSV